MLVRIEKDIDVHISNRWSLGVIAMAALTLAMPAASAAAEVRHPASRYAKVTASAARATALARVRGGMVKSAELEQEGGKWVWSFDIAQARSPNVVEVQVDARTGRIVSTRQESPAEQAKEARADQAAKR